MPNFMHYWSRHNAPKGIIWLPNRTNFRKSAKEGLGWVWGFPNSNLCKTTQLDETIRAKYSYGHIQKWSISHKNDWIGTLQLDCPRSSGKKECVTVKVVRYPTRWYLLFVVCPLDCSCVDIFIKDLLLPRCCLNFKMFTQQRNSSFIALR